MTEAFNISANACAWTALWAGHCSEPGAAIIFTLLALAFVVGD